MRTPLNRSEATKPHLENAEEPKAVMLQKYERCNYCHTKLLFTHDLNLSYLEVVECSRCPGCGVSMAPRKFTLH